MAQLLKPQNVKVVTKDGELIISLQLDININLNQSGTFDCQYFWIGCTG